MRALLLVSLVSLAVGCGGRESGSPDGAARTMRALCEGRSAVTCPVLVDQCLSFATMSECATSVIAECCASEGTCDRRVAVDPSLASQCNTALAANAMDCDVFPPPPEPAVCATVRAMIEMPAMPDGGSPLVVDSGPTELRCSPGATEFIMTGAVEVMANLSNTLVVDERVVTISAATRGDLSTFGNLRRDTHASQGLSAREILVGTHDLSQPGYAMRWMRGPTTPSSTPPEDRIYREGFVATRGTFTVTSERPVLRATFRFEELFEVNAEYDPPGRAIPGVVEGCIAASQL